MAVKNEEREISCLKKKKRHQFCIRADTLELMVIIIIIIIYNLYRGKAPVTRSDFQGGPLRVKIKYTKAKNIQYN